MYKKLLAVGALPRTPFAELTALPRLCNWVWEGLLLKQVKGGNGAQKWSMPPGPKTLAPPLTETLLHQREISHFSASAETNLSAIQSMLVFTIHPSIHPPIHPSIHSFHFISDQITVDISQLHALSPASCRDHLQTLLIDTCWLHDSQTLTRKVKTWRPIFEKS